MKILLDECLPLDFRLSFPQHDTHSAEWAGFKGMKNGELLKSAEGAAYDVLLTVDQALPQRQNLVGIRLATVVLHSVTNQLEDLLPLVKTIEAALEAISPGSIVTIG